MEDLSNARESGLTVDGGSATRAVDAGLANAANESVKGQQRSGAAVHERLEKVKTKYAHEREKRMRINGLAQYINVDDSEKFRHLRDDTFAHLEPHAGNSRRAQQGDECKYLIVGAGVSGLCAAARLRISGVPADDISIADSAGGFGGTWYWNRYPGLMCDVESYIYLPLLEQTGYIPLHKYSYGPEIRSYLNSLADKYDLRRNAIWSADISESRWDDEKKRWITTLKQKGESRPVQLSSKFFIFASGLFQSPKVPAVPGIESFKGDFFHTSRWNYDISGGTADDQRLEKLRDKTVAIIGTGATAVQVVPALAPWVEKLYVVQRTPSAVDWRGQHRTDPERFKKEVATHPGWQHDRNMNFAAFLNEHPDIPKVNLVADAWTFAPAMKGLQGGSNNAESIEAIPDFVQGLQELDFERQERIRRRVDEIVQDPQTAQNLKAWYPSWCKRPTFHDDYLASFNLPNVELVDTNGKGIDALTETGIVSGGRELSVDTIVLGTGFKLIGTSPCKRANMQIIGRDGLSYDAKFESDFNSLHGLLSYGFPNLLMFQVSQWAPGSNWSTLVDRLAVHMVHVITQAREKAQNSGDIDDAGDFVIEPSAEAERRWGDKCAKRAFKMAAAAGCTPSYLNSEGQIDKMTVEQQISSARKAPWGEGWTSFNKVIDAWESEGNINGIKILPIEHTRQSSIATL